MVAVGYMDPGNWGNRYCRRVQFWYTLLSGHSFIQYFAMVLSNILSFKTRIAAERDLAQACRDHFSPTVNFILWVLCEIAIIACDLAEVIGSGNAFKLLLFEFRFLLNLLLRELMFCLFDAQSQRF